ncbi:hypothetical protein EPUS_07054 [Endocarpon pusillum Z07020]|uniref:Uncharacterized protein n=1 Tax=Endocarpon pusillum (strain Z07020 / HMAS-L-300199) TaxID=1263415 RepID=U1GCL9_ENDPU|nr:uncharacterized protein EPUS_07054 [Endocarpon pusillum Z07020]ERF69798.1 hypothetical protein EPUS_07054 [Endocarpon pusillum Z07020]
MTPDSKLLEVFQDVESHSEVSDMKMITPIISALSCHQSLELVINYFKMVNTRANKYPSLDSPPTGFKRSAKAAGLLDDSARAGIKKPGEEAALAGDVRTDNDGSQVAILQPQGPPDLGAAPSKLSMSDLGSFPTTGIVGRAKATLANVLSARFPEVRRIISRDLNRRDRRMMLRTCHNLRVSINSQDHLAPFSKYFSGRCDAQVPGWGEAGAGLYSDKVRHSLSRPCSNWDGPYSIIKLCEGPRILKKAACDGTRGVCVRCVRDATDLADPGGTRQCLPNFGVTPICDACFVSTNSRMLKSCRCTGLPRAAGERNVWDLWLCFACQLAYNVEQAQFADDMARAYLYMKKNKHTNTLEYLPNAKISSAKLPTCPCGDARLRTKVKDGGSASAYGMCVWCGGLKTTRFHGLSVIAKSIWEEDGPAWRIRGEVRIADQVIPKEALIAIHNQIKQKGLPPPLPRGANKYWSYASVTDEPRLLDEQLRNEYETERRKHPEDRKRLNWDDREGFIRNFRWQTLAGSGHPW